MLDDLDLLNHLHGKRQPRHPRPAGGASREVVTGIEIGLELSFDHGRTSVLVKAEEVSGNAATILVARLADLLGDTEAGHFDLLLALIAALRATVVTARRERVDG